MALEVEVSIKDKASKESAIFEVMPRIGEQVEFRREGERDFKTVVNVVHYQSGKRFQAGIVVE